MKKIVMSVLLSLVVLVGAFAERPSYFAFEIGAGGGYDINTGNILSTNNMGFHYSFNESFGGGFSFVTVAGTSIDVVSLIVTPIENMSISMYTGQVDAGILGFGVGVGYDIFTKKEGLFTALGLYFDWFAGNGGAYDIANGGVLNFGMKTSFGM